MNENVYLITPRTLCMDRGGIKITICIYLYDLEWSERICWPESESVCVLCVARQSADCMHPIQMNDEMEMHMNKMEKRVECTRTSV